MTDIREQILARLLATITTLPGVTAHRNNTTISEDLRPAVVLLDGEETADPTDRVRYGVAPRRIEMRPQIALLIGAQPDEVGSDLNALRATAILALANDLTLSAMTVNNSGVVYEGAQVIIENGRRVDGALLLNFALTYVLRPDDLAP